VYILDDVTSLRVGYGAVRGVSSVPGRARRTVFAAQLTRAKASRNAHVSGENPQYGADIDFSLTSGAPGVAVSIVGPGNAVIRTLTVAGHPGLNRVWWDLRYDNGLSITMQTPPLGEPWAPARRQYAAYGTRIPPAGRSCRRARTRCM